jgi:hypothetical protein
MSEAYRGAPAWEERDLTFEGDVDEELDGFEARRVYKRTPVVRMVEYSPYPRRDPSQRSAVAFTANESQGGLCMLTRNTHVVGEPLRICVREVGGETRLEAIARVTWCNPDAGGRVAVGLEFIEVRMRRPRGH